MPLRPARVGRVGVIRAPVAKTAVVAAAVTPGRRAPVAKTAVVAAAVTPGRRAPVAKTAVVAAAVTPRVGRRRI
jgi:UDP-3-O-[3-hydroxymyristoyl] glucosamine N-acyltransferase